MTRRELLAAGAAFATCATPLVAGKTHIDKSRISAITDEIGLSTLESIAFAHFYGLQNVEIRNPPGKREYFTLPEPEIKADADLRRIPVVVLTTSRAEEDILRTYDLHANCFITKPVRFRRTTF